MLLSLRSHQHTKLTNPSKTCLCNSLVTVFSARVREEQNFYERDPLLTFQDTLVSMPTTWLSAIHVKALQAAHFM